MEVELLNSFKYVSSILFCVNSYAVSTFLLIVDLYIVSDFSVTSSAHHKYLDMCVF